MNSIPLILELLKDLKPNSYKQNLTNKTRGMRPLNMSNISLNSMKVWMKSKAQQA